MCWLCWTTGDPAAVGLEVPTRPATAGPAATSARLQLALSGDAALDALQSGFAWADDGPVSFAFTTRASDYEPFYGASEPARNFSTVSAAMRDAVRKIITGQAEGGPGSPGAPVTGFTLLQAVEETGTPGWAEIRVARSSAPATAWAYYPNGREGGDVWFGRSGGYDTPRLGAYSLFVAIHELGHAFGLKHAHEVVNGFPVMAAALDSLEYTVMSYRSKPGGGVNGYTNGTFDYPQTYMMLDIAALQELYGANYAWRSGDTRYAWDPATGETFIDGIGQGAPGDGAGGAQNRVFMTIWDGGGVDTYDLSGYATGVLVDLAPGGWSIFATDQLAVLDTRDGTRARGNLANALLVDGNPAALIENATGGAGADTLLGNLTANLLQGGAGNDLLRGFAGDDSLVGGAGADTMEGGPGDDAFVQDNPGDRVLELPGEGVDTLLVETALAVGLPEAVEILRLGQGGLAGRGNGLGNLLVGNAAANRLEGGAGSDMLEGRGGNDTLVGGSGRDTFLLRRGDGTDRIEDFNPGADRLVLTGFGIAPAGAAPAALAPHAREISDGTLLDLGHGDGLLLAGIAPWRLAQADIVWS
jgi:serralysin